MKRFTAALAALLLIAAPAAAVDNIVLIIADDLGPDTVEAYSGVYPFTGITGGTPTIGALATNGIRFDRFSAEPDCSPFRASLLTGRAPFRHGVGRAIDGDDPGLDQEELNIAKILRGSGYRTVAIGKVHMQGTATVAGEFFMQAAGFDEHHGAFSLSAGPNYSTYSWYDNGAISTDPITYVTSREIAAARAELPPTGGSEPFFMWLAVHAPHTPYHCPNQVTAGLAPACDATCTPGTNAAKMECMLNALDNQLSLLFADANWDWNDTCVIFVGDNGPLGDASGSLETPYNTAHGKQTVYQQGVRTPLIVRGHCVNPTENGTVGTQSIHVTDIAATILTIAGLGAGVADGSYKITDGISITPYLNESSTETIRKITFAENFEPQGIPYTSSPTILERRAETDKYARLYHTGGSEQFFENIFTTDIHEATPLNPAALTAAQQAAYDMLDDFTHIPNDGPTPLRMRRNLGHAL